MLTCHTCFEASGSEVSSRHQEQNRKGCKAHSGQYMTSWVGLLQRKSMRMSDCLVGLWIRTCLRYAYRNDELSV
jgi:hypothetical protein